MDLIEGIKTYSIEPFKDFLFHLLWEMDLIEGIKTQATHNVRLRLPILLLWEMDLIEGIKTLLSLPIH